jgi:P27 family predicted phage terminase small subunit
MAKKARTAPAWLEDAAARRIWERLHQDLVSIRFLESTDHNALGRYCQYMAEWISHTRVIRKEGATYTTSSKHVEDMVRLRPEVRLRERCETAMKALEDSLGLNPRYRFAITQALLGQKPIAPQDQLPLGTGEDAPASDDPVAAHASAWEGVLHKAGGQPN